MNNFEESRWRAVEERDDRMDGVFVYGVRTTNVFCRPGCGSRRPLRRNVEFFATPADALDAGYRACKRCGPEADGATDPSLGAVIALCRRLEHSDGDLSIARVAAELGYSERHLRRRFTEIVGVPIGSYLRAQQADRTRSALRGGMAVTDAVVEAGYGSSRAFYEHGATRLGMSPQRYRAGAKGERISYTTIITTIGVVLAASTNLGVCAVRIGSDETALADELRAEFPLATITRDDDAMLEVAELLAGAVRGEKEPTILPVDLTGTAFQMRVWEALRRIPTGQTRTYSELALEIGSPRAVRAVGSACAANPAALAVPCHRVVRRDGTLGGYRWGIDTKAALLTVEAVGPSA